MGTILRMFLIFWKSTKKTHLSGFWSKILHLWVDMTHRDDPNPNHIDVDYDPRSAKVNPKVWTLQPYYSTFYGRNSVKKRWFFDLKTDFSDCRRFLVVWTVGCGWRLHTIFGPCVPHTLTCMRLNFQTGAMKSQFAAIFCFQFWSFFRP